MSLCGTSKPASILAIGALLLLVGCDTVRLQLKPTEQPDLKCSAQCFVKCDPLPKWNDGDRTHEDTIVYVDGLMYGQCSARHDACTQCLTDAKTSGAIK
jgi:hypothetical protein